MQNLRFVASAFAETLGEFITLNCLRSFTVKIGDYKKFSCKVYIDTPRMCNITSGELLVAFYVEKTFLNITE